jgi:asparagine synthase (glutamine-hydrolysing)
VVNEISKKSHIAMRKRYGWRFYENNNSRVWFFGYQYNANIENTLDKISLALCNANTSDNDILNYIRNISGHFSMVVETSEWVVAAVDKICTNPIFVVELENDIFISNYAPILKDKCDLDNSSLNLSAGLEVHMAGHTIGNKTLYNEIKRLEGGECILYNRSQNLWHREFYYTYSPWRVKDRSEGQLVKEFTDICTNTLKSLKESVGERQIVIPLSAGNDSRLIASGLKELGVKNVVCFSYGRMGNFETPISKDIANRLGYKWLHIPVTIIGKRRFFKSDDYRRYVEEFESYGSVPNVHEAYEVSLLKNHHLINNNAIIVNGNSGDFISGGHISSILNLKNNPKTINEIDWGKFLDKHFSLWSDLRNTTNDTYIISELKKVFLSRNIEESINFTKHSYAVMEFMECVGRQSRIVANQQRTYEYFGYDWRLPLWSDDMLFFWESVCYEHKVGQRLYLDTLRKNNWGNVWIDIDVNNKIIRPFYLRWVRTLFKIPFVIFGKSRWHKFEKNVFEYFIHPSCALASVSYFRILIDHRGYRSILSWLSIKMLRSSGIK